MEDVGSDIDRRHIGVGDGPTFLVRVLVESAADGETFGGYRGGDEINNHLVADQGLATPVLADE
jgi:hypothetical protein